MEDFAGTSRFKLKRMLGEGGMGVVYEALDVERGQKVALKTLRAFSADALFRFKREFRVLQALHHPNLVNLGELIEEGGQWFFTMELVDGVNFVKYVRGEDQQFRPSFDMPPDAPPPPSPREAHDLRPTAETDDQMMQALIERASDLPGHPHGEGELDLIKLRVALAQLAEGLGALHRAGKVHRDVKPSNILVTDEGRVVLLDFGLVAEQEDLQERRVVGTVDYMAPEQALGTAPGPAADWYSVGSVLYEALCGRPPFVGPSMEVLMGKQRIDPLPPSRHAPSVPKHLDDLCMALLARDPAWRPGEREILRRIGLGQAPAPDESGGRISMQAPFVGRQRLLGQLHEAFHDSRTRPLTVLLRGEAGVGRSALVDQLARELSEQAIVLSGRCQERESVPFKAFDGVIDSLSRQLARLSREELTALLPAHAATTAHVFPVLSRIEAVAALAPAASLDLPSLRARAFTALRELLARLAATRPIVITIDDYHWADADSRALRRAVLGESGPPLLFLATLRLDAPEDDFAEARMLTVGRLGADESRQLVVQLLREGGAALAADDRAAVEAIAVEGQGHPMFIDQLVRYALESGGRLSGPVGLAAAIWSRIRRLDEPLRRIVELLAVAKGPLSQETAAAAAGLEFAEFARLSNVLRVAHLVRTSGGRRGDTIEAYHAEVRSAVLAHLPPQEAERIATFLPQLH
jgi:serine/threonine protein kinase